MHVDAAVLADETAAGQTHLEGGPPLTAAQARRILGEATAVLVLEQGREPLAVGRRKRRATAAQRRALLRRDGGCARPGCPETRIERLHAHHMRRWIHGGRTDLPDLVLRCDTDHGFVHEHDLVLARRDGRLVVTGPDGRRLWGTAAGIPDPSAAGRPARTTPCEPEPAAPLRAPGRVLGRAARSAPRPAPRRAAERRRPAPARPRSVRGRPTDRDGLRRPTPDAGSPAPAAHSDRLGHLLFPDGEPALPDVPQERYDRMDLRHAIGVLMGNRDLARRLAAETGVPPDGLSGASAGTPRGAGAAHCRP